MLIIVIFGMVFIAISEIQSNAAHPNPFNYGNCPLSQFATGITTSTLDCTNPPAQTNEYYGTCPLGQYATAITTTTLNCTTVQTQTSQFFSYGTCPNNQYATAITTTTLNCATVTQLSATFQSDSHNCVISSITGVMSGFKLNFTAQSSSAFITVDWALVPPATANHYTLFQILIGTGNAPACNSALPASYITAGQQFQQGQFSTLIDAMKVSETAAYTNLAIGTTYWVDFYCFVDNALFAWTYETPQLSVVS